MAIKKAQIIEAIHAGTETANRNYEDWSNGAWVTDSGVEGLLAASIAQAVHECQTEDESLLMELSFGDIEALSGANAMRGPRPVNFSVANRADIVLLNRVRKPICIIEVKRSWNRKHCLNDLDRVYNFVRRLSHSKSGSIQRGFLAFTIAKKATRKKTSDCRIIEHIETIKEQINAHFRRRTKNIRFHTSRRFISLGERHAKVWGEWKIAGFCVEIYAGRAR